MCHQLNRVEVRYQKPCLGWAGLFAVPFLGPCIYLGQLAVNSTKRLDALDRACILLEEEFSKKGRNFRFQSCRNDYGILVSAPPTNGGPASIPAAPLSMNVGTTTLYQMGGASPAAGFQTSGGAAQYTRLQEDADAVLCADDKRPK